MTATNHILAGAVAALAIKPTWLAVVIAFISHFVIDAIPHFGPPNTKDVFERNKKRSFQFILVFGIATSIVAIAVLLAAIDSVSKTKLAMCVIAALWLDFIWVYRFIREIITKVEKPKGPISNFHVKIQKDTLVLGAANEIVWAAAMITLIVWLDK